MTRWVLIIFGLAFGGFGLVGLVSPSLILGSVGIALGSPDALAEARAMYGGSQLGLALFYLLAVTRPKLHESALLMAAAIMGGFAVARGWGVLVDGATSFTIVSALVLEIGACGLALVTWRTGRSTPA